MHMMMCYSFWKGGGGSDVRFFDTEINHIMKILKASLGTIMYICMYYVYVQCIWGTGQEYIEVKMSAVCSIPDRLYCN